MWKGWDQIQAIFSNLFTLLPLVRLKLLFTFHYEIPCNNSSSKRPSSLVAIVRPIQAQSNRDRLSSDTSGTSGGGGNGSSSEDLLSLSRLPSPMERSGSLIPDLELPAPVEFMDRSSPFWSDPGTYMCIIHKSCIHTVILSDWTLENWALSSFTFQSL